jgi:hypothetical protein
MALTADRRAYAIVPNTSASYELSDHAKPEHNVLYIESVLKLHDVNDCWLADAGILLHIRPSPKSQASFG